MYSLQNGAPLRLYRVTQFGEEAPLQTENAFVTVAEQTKRATAFSQGYRYGEERNPRVSQRSQMLDGLPDSVLIVDSNVAHLRSIWPDVDEYQRHFSKAEMLEKVHPRSRSTAQALRGPTRDKWA